MTLAAPPLQTPALSADALAEARGYVESIIGRPLREAERAIDVLRLDGALNAAKEEVVQAIRAEIRRAAKRALPVELAIRLEVTRAMLRPLERLVELGREEAAAELERHGYEGVRLPPKRSLEDAAPRYDALWLLREELRDMLGPLAVRVNQGAVEASLGETSSEAIARALMRTPGGRNIASQLVSSALIAGMAPVFEENAELVRCWEYTAVLDGATCSRCAPLDGQRYPSWEAIQTVLPNGGPNPACLGRGRCRCRAVPCSPAEGEAPAADLPDDPYPGNRQFEEHVRREQSAAVEGYADALGLDVGEYFDEADAAVARLVEGREVRKRTDFTGMLGIARDGRIRSQFETGTSHGALDPTARAQAERLMFGYPRDLPSVERPIYGYLSGSAEDGIVSGYGDVVLRFKLEIRDRTSFSLTDSLETLRRRDFTPVPLARPSSLAVPFEHTDIVAAVRRGAGLDEISWPYAEAQLHGGVSLGDVAEVVFTQHRDWQREIRVVERSLGEPGVDEVSLRVRRAQLRALRERQRDFSAITRELDRRGIPWRTVAADDPGGP